MLIYKHNQTWRVLFYKRQFWDQAELSHCTTPSGIWTLTHHKCAEHELHIGNHRDYYIPFTMWGQYIPSTGTQQLTTTGTLVKAKRDQTLPHLQQGDSGLEQASAFHVGP
jgi:hypothetical protein